MVSAKLATSADAKMSFKPWAQQLFCEPTPEHLQILELLCASGKFDVNERLTLAVDVTDADEKEAKEKEEKKDGKSSDAGDAKETKEVKDKDKPLAEGEVAEKDKYTFPLFMGAFWCDC